MASVVFDASAVLALIRGEPGAEIAASLLGDAVISAVNFHEVIKALLDRGVPLEAALEILDALHLDIRPHGREDAIMAASLHSATRSFGSGLGDRACMALAILENLPALTADQAWTKVRADGLTVRLIR
jgi:PIN domain nuclease of toxin-antitoxin system